ncbi:Branched-chain amino acid transport system permease protein LivM [Actinokineospora spheciospongiae]|uniref:Branched-chain amino acid transport system permease protein LivM n=1 Tax=Actinokineospora spheciospongiae TaxID=909613 RepID=W7J2P3_9PSEU|nr:branched-chain amino acid ABC transporter permease [Actinokineospora spheciospongiae]EWC60404.1 Branched-chain amino acid transport system permease protein LivM [Actinokineospora spheciospongiae]PWW66558.1 amino acid/amide ABC transporter membrane protein 2 (HAAT family) [Actinokineospora spheciospongiae]
MVSQEEIQAAESRAGGIRSGRAPRRAALPPLVRHLLWALLAFAVVVAVSSVVDPFTNVRVATVGYLLLAAAGLTVLTGLTGQVSLGHGAFLFVGAYTVALLVTHVPSLPFWADLLIAAAVSGVAGVLTGAAAARLHGPYLAGATLALAVGLPAITQRFPDFLGGSNGLGFTVNSMPAGLDVPTTRWQAWVVWATVLLGMVVLANITSGRVGREMRAVRDDEVSAALAGIRVGRTKVLAFLVSAVCGGLAGGLQAFLLGTAAPGSFTPALSLTLLAAVVLGGVGSLWGALWGALALVALQAGAEELAHGLSLRTDVANFLPLAIFGVVLIVVVLVLPQGIHGLLRKIPLRRRKDSHVEG